MPQMRAPEAKVVKSSARCTLAEAFAGATPKANRTVMERTP
jgi:hypothetical protein